MSRSVHPLVSGLPLALMGAAGLSLAGAGAVPMASTPAMASTLVEATPPADTDTDTADNAALCGPEQRIQITPNSHSVAYRPQGLGAGFIVEFYTGDVKFWTVEVSETIIPAPLPDDRGNSEVRYRSGTMVEHLLDESGESTIRLHGIAIDEDAEYGISGVILGIFRC